ncbi:hypothetical protein Tco_1272536, partial [Tanacetum coccineum]
PFVIVNAFIKVRGIMRPDADTLLESTFGYNILKGLAGSMPTSGALDHVAEKLNLPFFEDLRHKDNSKKALECLNDMVTNSLRHMEVCLKSTQNELATVNTVEIAKKNYLVNFVFDSLIKNYEVVASSVGEELFYHVVVQGALADAFVRENDLVVNAHGMAALDATPIQTTWFGPLVDPAASRKKHVDSTSKSSKYMVILRLKQLIFSFKHYMRAAKYDLPTKMSCQEQYQVCAYKDGEVIIDTAAGVLRKYDPRPEKNHSFGKRVQNSVTLKDVASGNGVSHLSQPSMSQNKIGHSNNKALKRLRAHDLLMINKHVADSLLGYTKIELASMWYDYRNLRPSSPSSSSFHDEQKLYRSFQEEQNSLKADKENLLRYYCLMLPSHAIMWPGVNYGEDPKSLRKEP